MAKKPLEGIRIVDFTRVIVGPLTTKALSDYGAEVIKVESRKALDPFRAQGKEPDLSTQFTQWNTGKLSITLDLTKPESTEVVKKLVAKSDVVIESFAGGVIEKLGLSYGELTKVKPDIIMLSSCMQGQTGPYARHPGWGFQLSALSGFCHITGWPDRQPPELGVYTDFIAPHFNVSIILAALLYRRRTGKGQFVDMAQFENGLQFTAPLILDYKINHRVAGRAGNRSGYAAPHGVYRCKAEYTWCHISAPADEEWESLCKVMGNPAWTEDSRFSAFTGRKENEGELDRLIEEWSIQYTPEQVVARLQAAGITAKRLLTGIYQLGENPPGTIRCRNEERWCAISVFTYEEWESFCRVVGNSEWTKASEFNTLIGRKENEIELDRLIEGWTVNCKAEDIMTVLQKAGIAAGVVETGEDQLEHDPQTKHRNVFSELDHPKLGKHHALSSPFILSKTPYELKRCPLLGEHNEYVLKGLLSMSDDEIAELVMSGALE
jgi:benzylsuccinate CoA-transferase BbsF subunit